jgi:hypothetical protein
MNPMKTQSQSDAVGEEFRGLVRSAMSVTGNPEQYGAVVLNILRHDKLARHRLCMRLKAFNESVRELMNEIGEVL